MRFLGEERCTEGVVVKARGWVIGVVASGLWGWDEGGCWWCWVRRGEGKVVNRDGRLVLVGFAVRGGGT